MPPSAAALDSSVSMCIAAAYFGLTRTTTSPKITLRSPSLPTLTETICLSSTPAAAASSTLKWMWRFAAMTPFSMTTSPAWALQRTSRGALKVAGLTDRCCNTELACVGQCNFNLRLRARRAKDGHNKGTLRADDLYLLVGSVLAGLREFFLNGKLCVCAKKRLQIRFRTRERDVRRFQP